jgi:NADH:ubiquinone oxidoreductase subunit E
MDSSPDDLRRDLSPILIAFPREQQYLLPALQRVQEELGRLPPWALQAVGEHLRVPPSELYGVATHFPELRLESHGAHRVRVCTGLGCRVLGGGALLAALEKTVVAESAVVLEESHCLFVCSVGPAIEVDGRMHGGLGVEQAVGLVRERLDADGRP